MIIVSDRERNDFYFFMKLTHLIYDILDRDREMIERQERYATVKEISTFYYNF